VELSGPTPGWHLYVAGTESFDAEDETAEWAVPDYAWWPDNRYLPIPEIDGLPFTDGLRRAVEVVKSIAPWRDVAVSGAAVGFDDGDFEVVYQAAR